MTRSLNYEIPGADPRLSLADVAAIGWDALFAKSRRDEAMPEPHSEDPRRIRKRVLEIGFGRGEFLLAMAGRSPGVDFVGIEISFKRTLKMARKVARADLENVRLLEARAQVAMKQLFLPGGLDEIWGELLGPMAEGAACSSTRDSSRIRFGCRARVRFRWRALCGDRRRALCPPNRPRATGGRKSSQRIQAVALSFECPWAFRDGLRGTMASRGAAIAFLRLRYAGDADSTADGYAGVLHGSSMTAAGSASHALRRPSLKDFALSGLRNLCTERGWPAYRGDQIADWLYKNEANTVDAMTNLPSDLRGALEADFEWTALEVVATQRSTDGTIKLLLGAFDGAQIEAVLIPEERRVTLCVSTQVGCPLTCSFCATGALGFTRNLTTAEIVDQVLEARRLLEPDQLLSNLVFMGMGEPLLNLPAVSEAIRLLTDPKAFGMAPRRVTVSTAGVLPQIAPLLAVAPIHLAVSLHATTDEVRDVLVPLNKRYPIESLLTTLREEPKINRRRPVFFEYTLMAGVNDSIEDARRLPGLIAGIASKVNVIPMNPHPDAPYQPPSREVVDRFTAALHAAGIRVTLRRDRGRDIDAACGQLANRAPSREMAEPA